MAKAINPVERDNDAPLQALKGLIQAAESQAAKLNGEGTRS